MQILRFVLLVVGSDALRTSRSATSGAELATKNSSGMMVKNLYTFGAPMMAAPALADPNSANGCFPGLRFVTKEKTWGFDKVDIVPPLLKVSKYAHTRGNIVFLYGDKVDERSCGWAGFQVTFPNQGLHDLALYVSRTAQLYPGLSDMATVALACSQNSNKTQVAKYVRDKGYGLVASARCETHDEVAHLIQNPQTLDCWLTFEGSDNQNDWVNNLKVLRTDFCGLQQWVHTGFKNCTMAMVLEPSFQNDVRPKLGHCRDVEVLGHSLGGSIAGLFTACAHNNVQPGQKGFDAYNLIAFHKKNTTLMKFL